ncbi:MAG: hypothetical protein ACRBF0_07720 [Calditrichia bacterium]
MESWDKEVYELTNLDYFIYLMINHLAHQLEKRFFIETRSDSGLFLEKENIGTLCFNIGDSFECFVEENGYDDHSLNHILDLNGSSLSSKKDGEPVQKRLSSLRSFLTEGIIREKNFRIELMDHVILDTLLQFYFEEVGVEIDEEDFEIIELADFVEDILIEYIRKEGHSLLERPADSAIDHFEDLLGREEESGAKPEWNEDTQFATEAAEEDWNRPYEDISVSIRKFIDDRSINSEDVAEFIEQDIEEFRDYLIEHANARNVYELSEERLLEFLTVWVVQKFSNEEIERIPRLFQTTARYVNWVANTYGVNHKKRFAMYYERVKTEVPRVIATLKQYMEDYSLFDVMLLRGSDEVKQLSGFYEIKDFRSRTRHTLDLSDMQFGNTIENVYLPSNAFVRLKQGDILQATLILRDERWEVLELHYAFPRAAKAFIG